MLENADTNMFYQKETMGTTIMSVKYDGGVIACADSRNNFPNYRNIIRRCIYS
jgi:20S proteasome alpha/beta subunit